MKDYIYSDVNLNVNVLNSDEQVFDEYSINQSIMMILGTVQGQRLFRPEFGANLYNMLFEPLNDDTASVIKNGIILAIERWEPRIRLINTTIITDYNNQAYYVDLQYVIPSLMNRAATFAFNLQKLPG